MSSAPDHRDMPGRFRRNRRLIRAWIIAAALLAGLFVGATY